MEKSLPDKIVKDSYKKYSGKWDADLADTGLPDKFSLECLEEFLWRNGNYTLKKVSDLYSAMYLALYSAVLSADTVCILYLPM